MGHEIREDSGGRFRALLDGLSDMVTVSDREGRVVYANPATERVSGYTPEEFAARHPFERVHPDDRARCEAALEELVRRPGLTLTLEHRILHGDGDWRWVEATFRSLFDHPAVSGLVATVRDATERKRAETALQESEERYRTLFHSMDEGYGIAEVLFDESERPVDLRWLEVNPQFERQTGLPAEEILSGKTIREVSPRMEEHWFEVYGRVALTGEPMRFVEESTALGRWFDVYAFRIGEPAERKVAVLHNDITGHKQREEWQRFLVELNDALRPLDDPVEIQAEAVRVLGERLGVSRAAYFETESGEYVIDSDYADGVPSLAGRYPIESFGRAAIERYRKGETAVVHDIADAHSETEQRSLAAIQAGAYIVIPLAKEGRFVAGLTVHSVTPRAWTPAEVAMVEETAGRTWDTIERARAEEALRDREERLHLATEAAELGIWELDLTTNASPVRSERHDRIFGYGEPPESWSFEIFLEHVHPEDRERIERSFEEALRTGRWEFECRIIRADGEERWITAQGRFYFDRGEPRRAVGTIRDITERKRSEEALSGAEQRYRTLFESMDEGYAVVEALADENGRWNDFLFVEVNPAFEKHTGLVDPVGRTGTELMGDPDPGWARIYGRVVEAGEPERVEQEEAALGRVFDLYAFRLGGAGSRRVAVLFTDITERKRVEEERELARERTDFLAEASRRLAESLDWEETLSEIARLAVPRICDLCIVDTLRAPGEGSTVRRLAAAHKEPIKERLAWELEERYPVSKDERSGIAGVVRTGESVLLTEVTDEWLEYMSQDAGQLELFRGLELGSLVIVPLVTHGRILGALTLASDGSGRRYDEEDLALAEDLARRAAQSMDNARLYEEQSHAARILQQSLLPPSLPEMPGMESAVRFTPATSAAGADTGGHNVGGDFYDLFSTPVGWAAVVGDVMGKGVEAAELTAMARYTIRTAAMRESSPSAVISTLNAAMLEQRSDHRFCTLAYGLLNPAEPGENGAVARLTICRGGHPPPLILRAAGSVEEAGERGLLVGIEPDPGWPDTAVELSEGDSVIFYTDGVTEARDPQGRMFGDERLRSLAAACCGLRAGEIADELEGGLREFQRGESPRDDVALLVLRASG